MRVTFQSLPNDGPIMFEPVMVKLFKVIRENQVKFSYFPISKDRGFFWLIDFLKDLLDSPTYASFLANILAEIHSTELQQLTVCEGGRAWLRDLKR